MSVDAQPLSERRLLAGILVIAVLVATVVAWGRVPGHSVTPRTGQGNVARASSATPRGNVTAMAVSPTAGGWETTPTGSVTAFGGATTFGSITRPLNQPIVGIAPTPDGTGYWLVASDGGVFSFGSAVFYGSTGNLHLNQPIVGMAATSDGGGYWLVASDGGVFAFGDAVFYGSTGGLHLNQPIVGMAARPNGGGYWLVASDGGIFSFGNASFYGSTGAIRLNRPIVGMAATADGTGYWLVASDGGVFCFGTAPFDGSAVASGISEPIVGIDPNRSGSGYTLVGQNGATYPFGSTTTTASSSSATPVTTPPTGSVAPGQILDLSNWRLTLPLNAAGVADGSNDAAEVAQPTLDGFSDPYFHADASGNGVTLMAPVDGATTSGSHYPRSELREMDGSQEASWSTTSGDNVMTVTESVDAVPTVKQQVVFAQIHGPSDDVFEAEDRYVPGTGFVLYVGHNGTQWGQDLDDGYVLGTPFTLRIEATGGVIDISFNGVLKVQEANTSSGDYFKAGAYTQSNQCTEAGLSSDCGSGGVDDHSYGQVTIYSLSASHS